MKTVVSFFKWQFKRFSYFLCHGKSCIKEFLFKNWHALIEEKNQLWEKFTHSRLVVVCIGPIPMEFDNIWMLELCEIFKNELYFFLLVLKIFTFRKLDFVPNDFDSLFCIHSQIGAVDSRHISLFHLKQKEK